MRNYKSDIVRSRIISSHGAVGACPFPGKHPLRLEWRIRHVNINNGIEVSYFGKFTRSAWVRFQALAAIVRNRHDRNLLAVWKLMDRVHVVAVGGAGSSFTWGRGSSFARRYFWAEYDGLPHLANFTGMRVVAAGPYWLYTNESFSAARARSVSRNIAANIPHVRSA